MLEFGEMTFTEAQLDRLDKLDLGFLKNEVSALQDTVAGLQAELDQTHKDGASHCNSCILMLCL